ncbi:MAG: hypothetical protein ACE5HR_07995, partial [bacterium]
QYRPLTYDDVSGILTLGGTILGTSKTANPYRYAVRKGGRLEFKDLSKTAIENLKKLGVTCLLCYSIQAPYPPFSAPKEQCLLAFNEG